MTATHPRFCPECGLVDQPDTTDRCGECGLTVLDDADPANKDAIAEAIQLRRQLMTPRWTLPGTFAAFGGGLLVGAKLTGDLAAGELFGYLGAIVFAVISSIAGRRRLTPAWRAAIEHVDHASGRRELRHATRWSATMLAAAVCIAFVPIQLAVGTEHVTYMRGDPPWHIATSMIAHGNVIHLLGNLLALFVFGITVDLRVGRVATLAILVASGIGGTLAQAAYSPEPMLGFSGAICGLVGATLALLPRRRAVLTLQGVPIPMPNWIWSPLWLEIITAAALADTHHHVGWVAHAGGFATGFLVALPLRRLPPQPTFELYEADRRARLDRLAAR